MATSSDNSNSCHSPRFAVTPNYDFFFDDKKYKALALDLNDSGMLLLRSREFKLGDILGEHLNLAPDLTVDCEVVVCHSAELGTGVEIDFMDDQNRRNDQSDLQEYFSQELNKLG